MAYSRNRFVDPAGVYPAYNWPVNHSEEEAFGRTHNVEQTATTNNLGLVRQQGPDDPLALKLSGTIFHEAQHGQFIGWWALSSQHSIYFYDFTGAGYEVTITSYLPTRKATLRNPRDRSIPLHYYSYTMEMDILRVLSGPWAGIVP